MEAGAFQLGNLKNRHYARGLRVRVSRETTRVHIPRTSHYAPTVYEEGQPFKQGQPKVDEFENDLQPCVVKRGIFGWKLHECPYHLVYIEAVDKKEIASYRRL